MERKTQKYGLINVLALLVVGIAGFAVARAASSLAGLVGAVYLGIGMLVAGMGWFHARLEENERLEKLEFDELIKSKSSSALFENRDAASFQAQHSREQFERYFIPVLTSLLCLGQGFAAFVLWRWISAYGAVGIVEARQPVVALALFGLFFLMLFILGRFSSVLARLQDHRLLRPGASWVLLSAYLCLAVALGLVGVWSGLPRMDFYVARVLCALLGLMAFETLVGLLLEMYRPRLKGKVGRPLYDSRLVGLLGQPEGLITTAAQALDYQFGFKVSETWFFQLLQRHLVTLLLAQGAVLLLSTCIVFIEPGEQGILERFGKPVAGREVLDAGAHWKLPLPIDRVLRFPTQQIQSFDIGFTPDPRNPQPRTILWTVSHPTEENFLVASRETATVETDDLTTGRRAPPVSLLTVSIPVQYQVTNVLQWAYRNQNPAGLLQDAATREVVRYLVSVDSNEIMSSNRLAAAEVLRERIQQAANSLELGVRIFFVGVQDIHPPVKVAGDYEKVVGARQTLQAKMLDASADAFRTNSLASARAFMVTNDAMALRQRLVVASLAKAVLFTNQIPAFEAAPAVYRQRVYFQNLGRAVAGSRKYVLLTTNTQDVIVFDLQDKIREDLLNMSVTPTRK